MIDVERFGRIILQHDADRVGADDRHTVDRQDRVVGQVACDEAIIRNGGNPIRVDQQLRAGHVAVNDIDLPPGARGHPIKTKRAKDTALIHDTLGQGEQLAHQHPALAVLVSVSGSRPAHLLVE